MQCGTGMKPVGPLNIGHCGARMNSADLSFVERFSSLGGSKCIVGIILGLQVMSLVYRRVSPSEVPL